MELYQILALNHRLFRHYWRQKTMPIEETLCPKCGKRMVPRSSKHGKFWGCPDFPRCNGRRNAEGEAPREDDDE